MYGYIYKLTYVKNNKIYIGAKISDKIVESYYGSGSKWNKEVVSKCNTYTDIIREILQSCETLDELNKAEQYWIKFYDSTNPDVGYNVLKGGNLPSIEDRQYMSEIIHNKMNDDYRQKISKGLSTQRKTFGMSDIHRQHLSKSLKGINIGSDGDTRSIQVYCIVNETKHIFHNKIEAARWWFENYPFSEKYVEITYTRAINKSIKNEPITYKHQIIDNIKWFLENSEILENTSVYCIYQNKQYEFSNLQDATKWWHDNYPITISFNKNLYIDKICKSIKGFKVLYRSIEYEIKWYRKEK